MTISPYERTKLWTKRIIYVILGVGALAIMKSCDKKKIKDITKEELKDNEKTAIIVSPDGKTTVVTRRPRNRDGVRPPVLRGGEPQPKDDAIEVIKGTDGARGTRVSIGKDGTVKLTERTYGFLNEFGTGIYASTRYARFFVDWQPVFYRRHGLNINVGITLNGSKDVRPGIAYSYLLPFKYLSNSSIIIGIDSEKDIFIGHRVKF